MEGKFFKNLDCKTILKASKESYILNVLINMECLLDPTKLKWEIFRNWTLMMRFRQFEFVLYNYFGL